MTSKIVTDIYEDILKKIKAPSVERTVWSADAGQLAVCLIEFRNHPYMEKVLHNMCNIYGGTDVMLYIIHGNDNNDLITNIVAGWTNVKRIRLNFDNISINTYNQLLTNSSTYEYFETEFVLVFQTDSLIRKRIPPKFFTYSYVGAPWRGEKYSFRNDKMVGNGGFSLRNVNRMKNLLNINKRNPKSNLNEDIFITNYLSDDEIPSVEIAQTFSVEKIYDEDPVGMHKVWEYLRIDLVRKLMNVIIEPGQCGTN